MGFLVPDRWAIGDVEIDLAAFSGEHGDLPVARRGVVSEEYSLRSSGLNALDCVAMFDVAGLVGGELRERTFVEPYFEIARVDRRNRPQFASADANSASVRVNWTRSPLVISRCS
ncbi:hypothetical protein [Acidisarcina polymorpha]|uniref:hypothetical protein n=1 Tax=Acidisarcina polymorpha TaxID=2211140 RepID=UPI000DEF414A|nr:hypothetical protein [Acidisarcina polymorpha]